MNGQTAEIIKANGGFMAVLVPAGTSEIEFTYQTKGLVPGLLITALAILLLILYLLYQRKACRPLPEGRPNQHQHRYSSEYLPDIPARDAYERKTSQTTGNDNDE